MERQVICVCLRNLIECLKLIRKLLQMERCQVPKILYNKSNSMGEVGIDYLFVTKLYSHESSRLLNEHDVKIPRYTLLTSPPSRGQN